MNGLNICCRSEVLRKPTWIRSVWMQKPNSCWVEPLPSISKRSNGCIWLRILAALWRYSTRTRFNPSIILNFLHGFWNVLDRRNLVMWRIGRAPSNPMSSRSNVASSWPTNTSDSSTIRLLNSRWGDALRPINWFTFNVLFSSKSHSCVLALYDNVCRDSWQGRWLIPVPSVIKGSFIHLYNAI